MASQTYENALKVAESLGPDDQRRLLEELPARAALDAPPESKHSILELRGLGKEIWEGMDAQEYVQHERSSWIRLEDIPIENALHEKAMFEKGESERKLNPEYFSGPVIVSDDERNRRITKVYKLCFQEADPHARLKVVSDFIAYFPRLAFEADWVKELLRVQFAPPNLADASRIEILRAIASGFRRAASANPREPAIQKSYRISGARMAMRTFQEDLSKWNEALEKPVPTPEWIVARAADKADELIKTYWKLGPRDKPRLTKLLRHGQSYRAAVMIAAKVFGVRERDLQTKLN